MVVGRFIELYKVVFDSEDNVTACGRERCQELILLANQLESDVDHGNAYTGFMNVENMRLLYKRVMEVGKSFAQVK